MVTIGSVITGFRVIQEEYLLKEVKPSVDLRINMSQIVSREDICSNPCFCGERHARQLLLSSDRSGFSNRSCVWLRISYEEDRIEYKMVDPEALDLKKCQYVFARVMQHQDHIGYLKQLAAPSFPGKKALSLVWNLMAVTCIQEMFFTDASTQAACCDLGSPISLHSLGVFTHGNSWYSGQGATASISEGAFRKLVFNCEGPLQDISESLDQKRSSRFNCERVIENQINFYAEKFYADRSAYLEACRFLYSLPINHLEDALLGLRGRYSAVHPLCETLKEAKSVLPLCKSIGDLVNGVIECKDVHHQLFHEVRDGVVANKNSVFFQYVVDTLNTQLIPDSLSCALAWGVLWSFYDILEIIDEPFNKISFLVKRLLKATDAERLQISQEVGSLLERGIKKTLLNLEENVDPAWVKVSSNSSRSQQERWCRYEYEFGIRDEFLAFHRSIQYITQLSFKDLQQIYPKFRETLRKRFHCEDSFLDLTIGELIEKVGVDEQEMIIAELLQGGLQHFSILFAQALKQESSKLTEKTYPFFMLAKTVCHGQVLFAFRIPEIN